MTSHLLKAEIHCHLEGAASPALVARQAEKYGIDTSGFLRDGQYVWSDFAEFIQCYDAVAQVFKTDEDYAVLTETYLTELAEANTIYSELIISPDHGDRIGLGADAYLAGIAEGIRIAKEKTGIETRIIVTGERHFGPERVIAAAEYAARARHPLVTGFNMAGEERMGRVADYARAFDIARDAGLGLTIHAGEVCGPESVADALDLVKPARIGHGVRAIEDAGLIARLVETGTVLEVCPDRTSHSTFIPISAAIHSKRCTTRGCASASVPTIRHSFSPRLHGNTRWPRTSSVSAMPRSTA